MILIDACGLMIFAIAIIVCLIASGELVGRALAFAMDFCKGFIRGLKWGSRKHVKGRYER